MSEISKTNMNYLIRLATKDEILSIIQQLKKMNRQTMNFRSMPSAQALVLLNQNDEKKIIGWQGFNMSDSPGLTEKFSLHLDPNHRDFLLGLALETALYMHLNSHGIPYAMLRMDVNAASSLLDYRKKVGFLVQVQKEQLPSDWLGMCGGCELFKHSCAEQVFFKIDVKKGLQFGSARLGEILSFEYPMKINLIEDKMRKKERPIFSARWAA